MALKIGIILFLQGLWNEFQFLRMATRVLAKATDQICYYQYAQY